MTTLESLFAVTKKTVTIPKLYLLTNDDEFELLMSKLDIALATGAITLLQIRRKKVLASLNGQDKLYNEALAIVALAHHYNVKVIINDDVELAVKLGVGVHLGQDDGSLISARRKIIGEQIIGRTCHGSIELVAKAEAEGASYAAMGAVFHSTTKPNAQTVTHAQLESGCKHSIAICVIGGLSVENVDQLKGLAIEYIAVVGDIMDLPLDKIASRCFEWQETLSQWHTIESIE